MNKKLVAVAIAGLLAAPLAQAQTANVTLYGRVNMDMEVVKGQKVDGTNPSQYRVSSDSSRFGIRGTESLGGGLNAIFQLENGSIGWDNATGGTIGGRDSFVGLQGSWGKFYAGYYSLPYDNITAIWGNSPTLNTGILASAAVWAQGRVGQDQGGFDNRVGNTIRWDSPVMSGWQAQVSYSIGGGATGNEIPITSAVPPLTAPATNSSVTSGILLYNNGPIQFGAAFQYNNAQRAQALNDLAYSFAGAYQFPKVKVGVVYERLDYDFSTSTSLTRNMYGVDVLIDAGPGQFYALWAFGDDGGGSAPTGSKIGNVVQGDNSSVNQWLVEYVYPLSKRTSLWTGYTQILNKSAVNYTFASNAYPVANGGKPQGFAVGMFHNF
jgi:predicted porin